MKAALIAATVLTLAIVCSLHKASSLGKLNVPVVYFPMSPPALDSRQLHSELPSRLLLLVSVPTVCVVSVCVMTVYVWVWCMGASTNKYSLYTHTQGGGSLVTSMAKCTEVWIAPSTSFHMFL